jgi:hypothetical protein
MILGELSLDYNITYKCSLLWSTIPAFKRHVTIVSYNVLFLLTRSLCYIPGSETEHIFGPLVFHSASLASLPPGSVFYCCSWYTISQLPRHIFLPFLNVQSCASVHRFSALPRVQHLLSRSIVTLLNHIIKFQKYVFLYFF